MHCHGHYLILSSQRHHEVCTTVVPILHTRRWGSAGLTQLWEVLQVECDWAETVTQIDLSGFMALFFASGIRYLTLAACWNYLGVLKKYGWLSSTIGDSDLIHLGYGLGIGYFSLSPSLYSCQRAVKIGNYCPEKHEINMKLVKQVCLGAALLRTPWERPSRWCIMAPGMNAQPREEGALGRRSP